jgi:hypothetical protein
MLPTYTTFRTAVPPNVLRSSCEVPGAVVRFQPNLEFIETFVKDPHVKLHKNPSNGNHADTCGQMDRRADMTKITGAFRCLYEHA